MLSATRVVSLGYSSAMRSVSMITRSFAAQSSEQRKRMDEYNRQRKAYREQVSKLRKQYAEESKEIERQQNEIRAKKVQANQEKMRRISEQNKLEQKGNARTNYEHLCNVEIMKSIRQTKGVINQLRRQRERNQNLRKMLLAHMPYVYNAYKLEEVETRVLKEMKEVVPFDRVFLAPPSGTVKDSDYLSYQDYEKISGIRVNNAVLNKQNKELYRKWQEANGIVAPAESAMESGTKSVKGKTKAKAKETATGNATDKASEPATNNANEPASPSPSTQPSSVEDAKEVAASSGATL